MIYPCILTLMVITIVIIAVGDLPSPKPQTPPRSGTPPRARLSCTAFLALRSAGASRWMGKAMGKPWEKPGKMMEMPWIMKHVVLKRGDMTGKAMKNDEPIMVW